MSNIFNDFLIKFVDGHRIVSTNDLTELQITEAKIDGRLYVSEKHNLGWVALPWHLSTKKDKAREISLLGQSYR